MSLMFGDLEGAEPSREEALARIGLGFAQGLVLYGLSEWAKHLGDNRWVAALFGALAVAAVLIPVAAQGAINRLKRLTLTRWLIAAGATVALLGAYDSWCAEKIGSDHFPSALLFVNAAVGLFITHQLIAAAQADRRWFADYHRYFDGAWKDGVRLVLAVLFVAALWILLGLGAALFHLIGIKLIGDIIGKPWFAFPATTTFFAIAIHITDVRAGLVRGIRTVALTLLSWLSPVMALIGAGFLAALPFTGLAPLWATKSAAGILLSAAAALIVLTNAAYQEGEENAYPPLALKWTARLTALLILPLVVIAAYGVALRIGQYGLTPERILATACVLVGLCYGVGYAVAACWPKTWMTPLERTNIATAHVVIAVLLALFSPIADPSRLSVGDQVHRLEAGKVAPDKFDYRFLRFEAHRYGTNALARLAARKGSARDLDIAARAKAAQKADNRYDAPPVPQVDRAKIMAVVGGGDLPATFIGQDWSKGVDPFAGCQTEGASCKALIRDLNGDGIAEIALFRAGSAGDVYGFAAGAWTKAGTLSGPSCGVTEALAAGKVAVAPPESPWQDLMVGTARLRVTPDVACMSAGGGGDVTDVALIKPH
ncbi:DUF4153 domain-containing protein [Phenylobacterium aquaticum]|uniref:DUF4153 domain-containing protein n=2 Tax=Phenylobacterium aquaticum TaxID=1763816 RepID=UPI0026EC6744|nr:DUF4153 domain-containing protein [Phenylobacterium aquaticum]